MSKRKDDLTAEEHSEALDLQNLLVDPAERPMKLNEMAWPLREAEVNAQPAPDRLQ